MEVVEKKRYNTISKRQKAERIIEVEKWFTQGLSTAAVLQKCSSTWGITERASYNYVTKVHNKWAKLELKDAESRKDSVLTLIRARLHECVTEGKDKDIQKYIDLLCKINGLYAADKRSVEVSDKSKTMAALAEELG